MRILSLSIAIPILAMAAVAAPDITAHVTIEPTEFPWHKAATFAIVVEAPADADVTIPDMKDKFGGLVVFGEPTITTDTLPNSLKRITKTYTLEAPKAEAGTFQAEPVVITIAGGEPITVTSDAITVRDLTPEEEEQAQKFAPALDPLNVFKRIWEYWQFWAGVALAALLGTVFFAWYRWSKRQKPVAPERILSPWELALSRLQNLEGRRLSESGMLEPFYVELSAILRHYIEDRFDLHAPERTTPEFLAEASNSGLLADDQQRMLAVFLRHSDRVKFAKYEPTREEAERNLAEVRRFVEETTPKPVLSEAAA